MSQSSIVHGSFTVERTFDLPRSRVFAAFADPDQKARWFAGPDDWTREAEMDFRVGGRETMRGGPKAGPTHNFEAAYWDIVPDERIVYTYEMFVAGVKLSVSLATIEFLPAGAGTRLVITEHGAYLDGHEDPSLREDGTRLLVDALAASLAEPVPA